jgi:hypothetical protein
VFFVEQAAPHANGPVHYGKVQTSNGLENKECFVMMLPNMNSTIGNKTLADHSSNVGLNKFYTSLLI